MIIRWGTLHLLRSAVVIHSYRGIHHPRATDGSDPVKRSSVAASSSPSTTEQFWDWCAQQGITSKRLSISRRSNSDERGLFVEDDCGEGAVLMSIPFGLCLNRELLMLSHAPWCRSI
eukprot:CAMPEP_0176449982 /NCGR_PEP_ID=MMETSP0127-20121128/26844_1 /TAXON_ID=938130 /ORGANISM="Platyophrya macrostoma, Strain WH" /LENGTH=116 /DNA_ID=CAMNT_0017837509 /DNA_START=49 /DNA_END=396 /DNA_ORIENTATION=+